MPREKDDTVYLDYQAGRMLRGAVERHVEIIGEAARRVSETYRSAHGEIPWRSIIGVRNILAHDYGEVKDDKMWIVATESIPALLTALEPLVPDASSNTDA